LACSSATSAYNSALRSCATPMADVFHHSTPLLTNQPSTTVAALTATIQPSKRQPDVPSQVVVALRRFLPATGDAD